jgi:hypothetical protein
MDWTVLAWSREQEFQRLITLVGGGGETHFHVQIKIMPRDARKVFGPKWAEQQP